MDSKVVIYKSVNADTRSADHNVSKEELLSQTVSHIFDVQNVGQMLIEMFKDQLCEHDHTKVDYIDEFYEDFSDKLADGSKDFKNMPWFKNRHMTERHHLNDSVPEDVNLLDVLEMVVDCTCAGLSRSGDVYDIKIPVEILNKAINNTKDLIISNVEIIDAEGTNE